MANGLEERYPFMDNDLVNFAMKIPIDFKLGNLKKNLEKVDENNKLSKKEYREYDDGKRVLRKAMEEFIPNAIINRKKQGFSAPDESWYRERMKFIKEVLFDENTISTNYIDKNYIENSKRTSL